MGTLAICEVLYCRNRILLIGINKLVCAKYFASSNLSLEMSSANTSPIAFASCVAESPRPCKKLLLSRRLVFLAFLRRHSVPVPQDIAAPVVKDKLSGRGTRVDTVRAYISHGSVTTRSKHCSAIKAHLLPTAFAMFASTTPS